MISSLIYRPGYSNASNEGQKFAANDAYFPLKMAVGQDIVNFRRDFVIARKVRRIVEISIVRKRKRRETLFFFLYNSIWWFPAVY